MPESRRGLSWERTEGPATGVGICLSGGGLRSASFSLGVIQALQVERGLLFGPRAARYLSAVSGGSYTAAAHAINAQHFLDKSTGMQDAVPTKDPGPPQVPPLARGSPEEQHILGHGQYLVTPLVRTLGRFAVLGLLNVASLIMLFVWAGTMLANVAILSGEYLPSIRFTDWLAGRPPALLVIGLALAVLVLVYGLYSQSTASRYLLPVPALGAMVIFAEPAFRALAGRSWPATNSSWALLLGASVALLVVTAAVAWMLQRAKITGIPAAAANWAQVVAVRVSGSVLLMWSGVVWYRLLLPIFDEASTPDQLLVAGLLFLASLAGGAVFSFVPDRASLHREYRNRIRSCFGVVRQGSTIDPIQPNLPLSSLRAPDPNRRLTPQLLISATANVSNIGPGLGRRAYAPFVLTCDVCGVPGTQASFATAKLELGLVPAGLRGGKEPLLSLFSAVAMTGAAVSPSMGRRTLPSARPVLAALNIRLGRWLPNAFSRRMRDRVAKRTMQGRFERDQRMGPGYNELIPEMLGISGPQMYVSDGGHYDNLGLMALLRARCAEIWCVDASPDPNGAADELKRVLRLAQDELGTTGEIDCAVFVAQSDGMYCETFTSGRLTYESGVTADIHIVKLGLSGASPQASKAYRASDTDFPYHSTLKQWYTRARFEAYRDLGFDSATRSLQARSQVVAGGECS